MVSSNREPYEHIITEKEAKLYPRKSLERTINEGSLSRCLFHGIMFILVLVLQQPVVRFYALLCVRVRACVRACVLRACVCVCVYIYIYVCVCV